METEQSGRSFQFEKTFSFRIASCDRYFSYEPELFPAALISKWHPIHVTLFPNGKGNMSGVKSPHDIVPILEKIPTFVKSQLLL